MRSRFNTVKSVLVSLLLWLIALVVTAFSVAEIAGDYASLSWPTVTGKILSGPTITTNRRETIYLVNISYEYTVAGEVHKSNRIRRSTAGSDYFYWEATAVNEAARHENSQTVTVHYPPERPYLGILDPGIKIFSVIVLLIGFAASVLAFAHTTMLVRSRKLKRP